MAAVFIACYPRPKDGSAYRFDMDYYLNKHMPLQLKYHGPYGLRSYHVIEPGADSPYVVQVIEFWDSVDGMETALVEASQELYADAKNYTDITDAFPIRGAVKRSWVDKDFVLL
ncbi:ethyl tert-butyl ether degradation [Stagonosporopsis vannaccii]|nr:ethyl tert-butyl ether degradation [Stagonosporopsis vannaccii]